MSDQRLRGQEVVINIVADGELEDTLTSIVEFNDEDQFEIKTQGYLGETTNRGDDIYNGTKFDFVLHLRTKRFWEFKQLIKDRATRKRPDLVFNVTVTSFFGNGDAPTITYPDVKWGPIPKNIPSRGDYVKVKMEGFVEGTDDDLS